MNSIYEDVKNAIINILDTFYTPFYNIVLKEDNGKRMICVHTKYTMTTVIEHSVDPCVWYLDTVLMRNKIVEKRIFISGYYSDPRTIAFKVLENILPIEVAVFFNGVI